MDWYIIEIVIDALCKGGIMLLYIIGIFLIYLFWDSWFEIIIKKIYIVVSHTIMKTPVLKTVVPWTVFIIIYIVFLPFLLIPFIKMEIEYRRDLREIREREKLYGNRFYIDADSKNKEE